MPSTRARRSDRGPALSEVHQNNLVRVRDLSVDFTVDGEVTHAVKRVSFNIRKGETVALVGREGGDARGGRADQRRQAVGRGAGHGLPPGPPGRTRETGRRRADRAPGSVDEPPGLISAPGNERAKRYEKNHLLEH